MTYEMTYTAEDAEGYEVEVTIEYEITAGCRGARENGIPIEPDSPAEVEILSVKDEDGEEFELNEHDAEAVIEKAFEDAEEAAEDAKAEAQIAAWEARHGY